jgi:hypothetical protein
MQGIPVVGTYVAFFLFGGPFPGTSIVPRMYLLHVLLIPGILLALITAHLFVMVHQKHTQMPGYGHTEKNVVGQPFWPYFLLKGQAWFFFIFGALVVLSTFAQINPVWLYGPYTPLAISAASQPDWYLGLLDGALRIMPAWELNFLGHTVTLSVLIPFIVPLGVILGGAALWPFFERWATGDNLAHHVNDRPRDAPVRTATGVAAMVFQLPDGEFIEEHRPLTARERAPLEARQVPALMPAPASGDDGVPAPRERGLPGRARAVANRAFAENITFQPNGHGHGHGHDSSELADQPTSRSDIR